MFSIQIAAQIAAPIAARARPALLSFGLGLLLLACSGSESVEGMPEDLRGQLQIIDVSVESRRGEVSAQFETRLREKLRSSLPEQPEDLKPVKLIIVIDDYQAPNSLSGGASSNAGTSTASGRVAGWVYLADWATGLPVVAFQSSAQAEQRKDLIDEFAAAVILEIF